MAAPLSPLVYPPGHASREDDPQQEDGAQTEWLETNALGGYACGTVEMTPTRRYHGLLVTPPPGTTKRHLFLAGFDEEVDGVGAPTLESLRSFEPVPWPRAAYGLEAGTLTREILCVEGQSTVLVRYRWSDAAEDTVLTLRPLLAFREADKLTFENDVLRREAEDIEGGIRCRLYDALPAMALTLAVG